VEEKGGPDAHPNEAQEFPDHENVSYSVHSHPEAYTALEIAALEHVRGRMLAKVVIVKTGAGDLVMLVLPADRRVDLRKVGAVLGSEEVRLAQESQFRDTSPACDVGSMPPFGNLFGLPVLVDERLTENDEIVFNAEPPRSQRSSGSWTSGGWCSPE